MTSMPTGTCASASERGGSSSSGESPHCRALAQEPLACRPSSSENVLKASSLISLCNSNNRLCEISSS